MCGVEESEWVRDRQRFVADAHDARTRGVAPRRDHGWRTGPLSREFAALTISLLDARTVDEVLEQVVFATAGIAPEADLVSVTLRSDDGRFHTPVSTDAVAEELDQLQYRLAEGPCITAARDPGPAVAICSDLGDDGAPWPAFGPAAVKLGARAVLSISLLPGQAAPRLSGALNLYSRTPQGLDAVDPDLILLLATHASLGLASTAAANAAESTSASLRQAIDSRDVIGQAKGILMGRRGLSAEEAFDVLRRTSQDLNVKLRDLAENLADNPDAVDVVVAGG